MARHSSFKSLVAYETYQRFLATVRARSLKHQDPTWAQDGDRGMPGDSQPPGPVAGGPKEPGWPFMPAESFPTDQHESWIESWLSGKISEPPG
jgi:hypothetical protein